LVQVHWPLGTRGALHLLANLHAAPARAAALPPGRVIHGDATPCEALPPWFVRVSVQADDVETDDG
jgi:hypothetical protein